jgi:SAM-dependent methyltransferase
VSETVPGPDLDPAEWADPAPTYDSIAASYAATFLHELDDKPFDRALLTRFAQSARARADDQHRVCDLGCGPGHVGAFVAEFGLPVVGIDLSAGMVAEARRSFPHLTFRQGDMTSLDLPDGALSGIVCFYALIHLPRSTVPVALSEMHRVMVDHGEVLVAVHGGQGSLHAAHMVEQPANLDATLFSLPELAGLMEAAGFGVVEAEERDPYEREHPTRRLYVWARRR